MPSQPLIWLKGDAGVDLDSDGVTVRSWRDQSKSADSLEFVPMSDSKVTESRKALEDEFNRDIMRHHGGAFPLPSFKKAISTAKEAAMRTGVELAIQFPCALISNNKDFILPEKSTYFFVLKAEYPGFDSQVCWLR